MDWDQLLDDMTATIAETFPKRIIYTRVDGTTHTETPDGKPLTGVFDYQAVESRDGASLGITNRQTILDVRLADLGFDPETRDTVSVDGEGSFTVLAKYPSSSGMMKLHLRKG